jgi:hypothetical protein
VCFFWFKPTKNMGFLTKMWLDKQWINKIRISEANHNSHATKKYHKNGYESRVYPLDSTPELSGFDPCWNVVRLFATAPTCAYALRPNQSFLTLIHIRFSEIPHFLLHLVPIFVTNMSGKTVKTSSFSKTSLGSRGNRGKADRGFTGAKSEKSG